MTSDFEGPLHFPADRNVFFLNQDNRGKWQADAPGTPSGNVSFLSPWMNTRDEAVEYARQAITRSRS